MGIIIDLAQRRSMKAGDALTPNTVGPTSLNRMTRGLCVGSAVFGFTIAAAIEAQAYLIALILLVLGFWLSRSGR